MYHFPEIACSSGAQRRSKPRDGGGVQRGGYSFGEAGEAKDGREGEDQSGIWLFAVNVRQKVEAWTMRKGSGVMVVVMLISV